MKNVGMVLAGGGGKGAYEVGVWLAMQDMIKELNLNIDVFSGASVGALNAALFACCTPKKVDDIWASVTPSKICQIDPMKVLDDAALGGLSSLLYEDVGISTVLRIVSQTGIKSRLPLVVPLIKIFSKGLFSREGLSDLIEHAGIRKRISSNGKQVIAACRPNNLFKKVDYITIDRCNYLDVLLASSALPIVFGKEKIEEEYYRDGGFFGDNVPVAPLLKSENNNNRKKIIVVHLSKDDRNSFANQNMTGCKVYHIFPEVDLGGIIGTFQFGQETIQKKKQQAINEIKKEYDYLKEIKELFWDDSPEEIHLLNGQVFNGVDDMYEEVSKRIYTTSFDDMLKKMAMRDTIMLKNRSIINAVRRINSLDHYEFVYLKNYLSDIVESGEMCDSVDEICNHDTMVDILGKDAFEKILMMINKSMTLDVVSMIRTYDVFDIEQGVMMIPLSKDRLSKREIATNNEILKKQVEEINIAIDDYVNEKAKVALSITQRHKEANMIINDSLNIIKENSDKDYEDIDNTSIIEENDRRLDSLLDD